MARQPSEYIAIHRAARSIEERLSRAFRRAVERLQGLVPINDLAMRLAGGKVRGAMAMVPNESIIADMLTSAAVIVADTIPKGGRIGADTVNRITGEDPITFRFDAKTPDAERIAARQAARMVTRVSKDTRDAIRALIVRSIREGIPVYDAARMLPRMIGMNAPQAQAAFNYRIQLINSGLPMERINVLMGRYVRRKIRERARMIARSEVISALNEGQQATWRQAKRDGLLPGGVEKEWITTPFDACLTCVDLDGKHVPLNEKFESMVGPLSGPTAHPNCRCALAIWTPSVERAA
jgi:hypothetical protein